MEAGEIGVEVSLVFLGLTVHAHLRRLLLFSYSLLMVIKGPPGLAGEHGCEDSGARGEGVVATGGGDGGV